MVAKTESLGYAYHRLRAPHSFGHTNRSERPQSPPNVKVLNDGNNLLALPRLHLVLKMLMVNRLRLERMAHPLMDLLTYHQSRRKMLSCRPLLDRTT